MAQGISSHGTLIELEESAGGPPPVVTSGVFTEIAELGDITEPGLMRNEFDITSHNRDIDTYVAGVLRREAVTFPMFFNKANDSQIMLRTHLINNTHAGYRMTTPDGDIFIFSGFVTNMGGTAPVDGVRTANVTIRPSGAFILNAVEYGL